MAFTDSTFACTNLRLTYNGSRSSKVIYLETEDPAYLYDVFLERTFPGIRKTRRSPFLIAESTSVAILMRSSGRISTAAPTVVSS